MVHPTGGVTQLDGEVTVLCVLAHPFTAVLVMITLVPTVIPVTVVPVTVPADAVTVPLLLKLTS